MTGLCHDIFLIAGLLCLISCGNTAGRLEQSLDLAGDNRPEPETSFDSNAAYGSWVGLDFGKPEKIGWIVYTPRNRDNYVRPGDEYELFYFDTVWKSAGTVVATADSILYEGLPSNTVYILDNHTRGNQIRVFSYDDGEQFWLRPGADMPK